MNHKKTLFTLTRKNQRGQVAIFVALIFQVIFVFFAMLINVGLIVHHKINLQQSTDLAAYYGAMKQAEMLNVVGHINFQIRQAWKLLTWRYRVLGTFGMVPGSSPAGLNMPINFGIPPQQKFTYNANNLKCPGDIDGNTIEMPAFCVGHIGFEDWNAGGTETSCKVTCNSLNSMPSVVQRLSNVGNFTVLNATAGPSINTTINVANTNIVKRCEDLTKIGISELAMMINSFGNDTEMKKKSIKLLLANLANNSEKFLDLNGDLVKTGVFNTLKNNLTEANAVSLGMKYKTLNGISDENDNVGSCGYSYGAPTQLFSEVTFDLVQFFLLVCQPGSGPAAAAYTYESIYQGGTYDINNKIKQVMAMTPNPVDEAAIRSAIGHQISVGFEKNPWCNTYYAVKASTEPSIPFLPLAKIKLNAVSIAKPFGSSIGPSYRVRWEASAGSSDENADKTDKTLPNKKINANLGNTFVDNKNLMPNYANYVGDSLGLMDREVVAIYHDFLLTRGLKNNNINGISSGQNNTIEASQFKKHGANSWPKLRDWTNVARDLATDSDYDPIGLDCQSLSTLGCSSVQNSHIRDIEISVVAPNQFDMSYYPIEPDFYNNYFKNKLDNEGPRIVDKLKANAGVNDPIIFRPDYGYNKKISTIPQDYSVRHQVGVVAKIFREGAGSGQLRSDGLESAVRSKYFTYTPIFPASLLSSWTYKNLNLNDYTKFSTDLNDPMISMPFGGCNDAWYVNDATKYSSITNATGNEMPPTSGNCVSGGRTGYSVKIVSPAVLRSGVQQGALGGEGTAGTLRNPIPDSFLNDFP